MNNGKRVKVQKETRDFRRFIEESFPVKEVGEASAMEKNIHQGQISSLHIWWARRPLAASRATAYAALTPYPATEEERENKKRFIIDLCQWENSNNQALLNRARREILEANGGVPPKVLDPFAGGGSYPLEALRLGCETYSSDYNPVAVLIEKATLEYPQKFGRPFENMPEWALPKNGRQKDNPRSGTSGGKQGSQLVLLDEAQSETGAKDFNPMLNAVRYWGEWVLEEARKELAEFYPPEADGSIPVGYIWARTIPCQNPACGQDIPLMRQYWLAKKDKKKVALYPDIRSGKLFYRIVGDDYGTWPKGFDPSDGTVSRAIVTCPLCGNVVDDDTTRRLFIDKKANIKMIVVVLPPSTSRGSATTKSGKRYRLPTNSDENIFNSIQRALQTKREILMPDWGMDPIPDEIISSSMPGGFHPPAYGIDKWGELFNYRQQLGLIVFTEKIREAYKKMAAGLDASEFSKVIVTYLALGFDRMANRSCVLNVWNVFAEKAEQVFIRQSIPMLWDYCEVTTIGNQGWKTQFRYLLDTLEALCAIDKSAFVNQANATNLQWDDSSFDAVLTDPPYYYSVTYADLSDFFFVWLKRTVGYLYPDLFSTPLTPKNNEIIQKNFWDKTSHQDSSWYETKLKEALTEIRRVLKDGGLAVIVYAHKTTQGWETLLNALLDSGLIITGSWPINTEMAGRMMANESASLASSIYIVARKMPRQPTGFYNEVRTELRRHLDTKLHRLWEEGIGGADFFIAAIGSAIEVFGKYEQVMDYEGNIVRAGRLLEEVRTIATDYAVRQILHNGFVTEISGLTRLYVLWRWNYGEAIVPFDEARKLGQSCGIDISEAWSKTGFVRKEKEFVRILGPQGRKLDDLDDPRDLIDVLHKTLLLWEKGQRVEMVQALAEKSHGKSEAFFRVAQAISETLPNESKEKKLLDGFLAGRERVQEEVEKAAEQGKLWKE